ncbi:PREDICTED: small integral membrane protein 4 [Drosophila arizonae]|uniref:Small integral membrane protein 4 n=1 Tax=Drosophila arizonae TaxID=7263 RepID=A0ABM1PWV0_DROAR|nr:PREDICTED: small integral membrane protein 4 [Drosophila arizonae]
MTLYSRSVQRLLDSWPGKQRFGIYRFLPIFFVLGAALEYSMINWTVGETNFYRTFKRRQAKNYVEDQLQQQQHQLQESI